MGDVIVQVCTNDDDIFCFIDEDRFKEIASRFEPNDYDLATLDQMKKDFWVSSKPAYVHKASEAEYTLVLDDGSLEAESWAEMLELWQLELDE